MGTWTLGLPPAVQFPVSFRPTPAGPLARRARALGSDALGISHARAAAGVGGLQRPGGFPTLRQAVGPDLRAAAAAGARESGGRGGHGWRLGDGAGFAPRCCFFGLGFVEGGFCAWEKLPDRFFFSHCWFWGFLSAKKGKTRSQLVVQVAKVSLPQFLERLLFGIFSWQTKIIGFFCGKHGLLFFQST